MGVHAERATELFVPDPEIIERYRPEFWQKVDQALAATVNQHERDSIIRTAGILDWQMFRPDEPLPDGLAIVENEEGYLRVIFDSRLGYTTECARAASDRLEAQNIEEVFEAVDTSLAPREGRMRDYWTTELMTSPTGMFLRGFAVETPADLAERPLPPQVRAEREEGIIREARIRHRLHDRERLQRRSSPNAAFTALRGIRYLEEETVRAPEAVQSDEDAIARARAFFDPLVAEAYQTYKGEPMTGIAFCGEVVITSENEPDGVDLDMIMSDVVEQLVRARNPGLPYAVQLIHEDLLGGFLSRLYNPNTRASYDQIVQEAVDEITETLRYLTKNTASLMFEEDDEMRGHVRHRLRGPLVDQQEIDAGSDAHYNCEFKGTRRYAGFVPREHIERQRQQKIGHLERPLPGSAIRLMQQVPRNESIPAYSNEAELCVYLWGEPFQGNDPHIPGYRLVSRDRYGTFGFARDEAGDPYAPIEVPLDDRQRETLREAYASLGLTELAQEVASRPDLTVEQLRALLMRYSLYVIPDDDARSSHGVTLPIYFWPSSLSDFEELIGGGRLHGQCTVFSKFYRLSLAAAFGAGAAATATGYVLEGSREITAERHEQTVFTYNGHVYISDATPADPSRGTLPRAAGGAGPILGPPRARRVQPQDIPVKGKPVEPSPEQRRRYLLQQARTALETHLVVVFRVPDTAALYDKVAAMPEHDPVRRTLELVLQAARGSVSSDTLQALWKYIENVGAADPGMLRQMGVSLYNPKLLESLKEAVVQTAHATGSARPGVSVAALTDQIEALIASLPHDELAISGQSLVRALSLLQDVGAPADVQEPLQTAHETWQRITSLVEGAIEAAHQYNRSIT